MIPLPPISTLFPYTTLFRSLEDVDDRVPHGTGEGGDVLEHAVHAEADGHLVACRLQVNVRRAVLDGFVNHFQRRAVALDRKSTRLNSSHGYISYAVFCLKKK